MNAKQKREQALARLRAAAATATDALGWVAPDSTQDQLDEMLGAFKRCVELAEEAAGRTPAQEVSTGCPDHPGAPIDPEAPPGTPPGRERCLTCTTNRRHYENRRKGVPPAGMYRRATGGNRS